jgi:lipopolysaccharide/colanic/teichoic acid biosynthesis glycosyltransferase
VVGGVTTDRETTRVTEGEEAGGAPDRRAGKRLAVAPPRSKVLESAQVDRLMRVERLQTNAVAGRLPREGVAYERLGKPVLDRVGAVALGVVTLPVIATIALIVRLMLGSPVFYIQERVGQHGKRFRMYKFRTMRLDRRRKERPFRGRDRRVRHKTGEDPRHTAVGRFLRRRSLDELPQLWNVVLGDMSLVGPRPELPSVVSGYGRWQHERHLCKPGLTGLWQVSTRNNGDGSLMCEHTEVDLRYMRVVSLRTDLWILCKTLSVLGGGE